MIAVVVVQAAVLVVLALLVVGLLRAYADILRRLHRLDGGGTDTDVAAPPAPPFVVAEGVVAAPVGVEVEGRDTWAAASDLAGATPGGELQRLRVVGVEHDTVLVFLSSGCTGCERMWEEVRDGWAPPAGRLLVVTKGSDLESPALVASLAGRDEVLMSTKAWEDYAVPGSPYVIVVDGRTGRVKGQGSGASLTQMATLISQATSDLPQVRKASPDRAREQEADLELLRAGIGPGHPSLYGAGGDQP